MMYYQRKMSPRVALYSNKQSKLSLSLYVAELTLGEMLPKGNVQNLGWTGNHD